MRLSVENVLLEQEAWPVVTPQEHREGIKIMNHVLIVPLARTNSQIHVNARVDPTGVVSRPPQCTVTVVPGVVTRTEGAEHES